MGLPQVINATALTCLSPAHTDARVPLEVGINGADFSSSDVMFEVLGIDVQEVDVGRRHQLDVQGFGVALRGGHIGLGLDPLPA